MVLLLSVHGATKARCSAGSWPCSVQCYRMLQILTHLENGVLLLAVLTCIPLWICEINAVKITLYQSVWSGHGVAFSRCSSLLQSKSACGCTMVRLQIRLRCHCCQCSLCTTWLYTTIMKQPLKGGTGSEYSFLIALQCSLDDAIVIACMRRKRLVWLVNKEGQQHPADSRYAFENGLAISASVSHKLFSSIPCY